MIPRLSAYPAPPGSHPVVARCASLLEASEVESALRAAGIACIRMDREEAALREGRPTPEAALILVSRADFARAKDVLETGKILPNSRPFPEPV